MAFDSIKDKVTSAKAGWETLCQVGQMMRNSFNEMKKDWQEVKEIMEEEARNAPIDLPEENWNRVEKDPARLITEEHTPE